MGIIDIDKDIDDKEKLLNKYIKDTTSIRGDIRKLKLKRKKILFETAMDHVKVGDIFIINKNDDNYYHFYGLWIRSGDEITIKKKNDKSVVVSNNRNNYTGRINGADFGRLLFRHTTYGKTILNRNLKLKELLDI